MLEPSPSGRFAALVEQSLREPPPTSAWAGPDLLSVSYSAKSSRGGKVVVHLGQLIGVGLVVALLSGGFYLQQRRSYREGVQHRLNGIALTRQGDFAAAHRQLQAAPEEADTYRARAELAVAEGQWQEAAEQFRKISVTDAEVNAHLDSAALERAQALIKQARLSQDTVKALSLSDQAESLLDQHNARPQQRAALHFLRAGLFEKLELRPEATRELKTALQLDPGHAPARQLLAQWTPRPVQSPSPVHRPPARPATPTVEIPRLQTQPDYPTYQPPDEDEDEERETSLEGSSRTRPTSKKRRSRQSGYKEPL